MSGTAVDGIDIFQGDCLDVMRAMPAGSVDLIVTSPPYAEKRKKQYDSIPPDAYPEWFCERSAEMRRILKPVGSFVLNMAEHIEDGERVTYVEDTVRAVRQQGWRCPDKYIWIKTNGMQGRWDRRFRNAWEYCFHFALSKKYRMYKDAVMVPPKPSTVRRYNSKSASDAKRRASGTGSGMTIQSFAGPPPKMVYPTNVIMLPNATKNTGHPAAFPVGLPLHFTKLFTTPGDMVLDPFVGGGSTLVAAAKLGRRAAGIDTLQKYCNTSRKRIAAYARTEAEA